MPRTGLSADEIKERAVELAIEKMRQYGFEKVRLIDIAKDLDLSHAALYAHFEDKSALLDAVSERWLIKIDEAQDKLCAKKLDPIAKIHAWCLYLHRTKREKVLRDPELYKSFDMQSQLSKPFVQRHMANMHRQLLGLVTEAMAKKKIKKAQPDFVVQLIQQTTMSFHHPKLVVQYIDEKRETLLKQTIDIVIAGLNSVKGV